MTGQLKAYNLRDTATETTPRGTAAAAALAAIAHTDDEDVVLIKVPKGQGPMVVHACADEHRVRLRATGFSIMHPLAERLADTMLDCPFHKWCVREFSSGPRGFALGTYDASPDDQGGYDLRRVP